ncbi:MAG TPA: anti-sigma factor [Thermomicrobiales bacterium]|nr:anti-sigma factor [Thermomicrobiales bacterium]
MNHKSAAEHRTIVESLPDYALGRLDDASASRVAGHLQRCAGCRQEFDLALDVLGGLAAAPPPSDWVRSAVLWRATEGASEPDGADLDAAPPSPESPPARATPTPFGKPLPRLAVVAASLAVMLIGSLAVWNFELRSGIDQHDRIYALVNNPAAAHPLQGTQLAAPVAGVVFAMPQGHDAYLVANGLPALPADERYQIWLFTDDKPVSAGLLSVGPDGDAHVLFETPKPFGDYIAVALSAEPQAGSAAPTSALTLGGSINPNS